MNKLEGNQLDTARNIIILNDKLNKEFSSLIPGDIEKYINIINQGFIDNNFNVCVVLLSLSHTYKNEIIDKLKEISVLIPTEIFIMFDDGSDISCKYSKKNDNTTRI